RQAGNTILFVPDLIATLCMPGGELTGRHIYAELLLTVRDGKCPCILAATPANYARCQERWGESGPKEQPVPIRPSNVEETLAVRVALRDRYEGPHPAGITYDALNAVAPAADRLPGALPGKAVALMDRCAARARLNAWTASPQFDLRVVEIDEEVTRL